MTWAKVGMKVVCIKKDKWRSYAGPPALGYPEAGKVYTISEILGGEYLALSELGALDSFNVRNFRPLVSKTQSQDVAMFKRIADQVPNMEKENV